jgi:hypothetical protein
MIFLIMTLVILSFVVLWNFDLHKVLHLKSISQNGGDAAALMASRWQGISLNLIGDLNLMKAIALSSGDQTTAGAIDGIQKRLLFTGPMVAFQASQQAAKNNGVFVHKGYSNFLHDHANDVRKDYTAPTGPGGSMLFPEPWEGAWKEYADMLDRVASDGIAAAPDNMQLFSDSGGGSHILMDPGFYSAIGSKNWCWFFNNRPSLLEDYEPFYPCWWSALPSPSSRFFFNSEIYSLALTPITARLDSFLDQPTAITIAQERRLDRPTLTTKGMGTAIVWYCYSDRWGRWEAVDQSARWPMPLTGPVRPQYDYAGADAAVRIEATTGRITPGPGGSTTSNTVTWTSAAKPFGYLANDARPNDYQLVLPAFHDVRLIPVDASSAPAGGGYDLSWREHIGSHLPSYINGGTGALEGGCYYCNQLRTWESAAFRASGVAWLSSNSDKCTLPPAGHGGGGGGGGPPASGGRSRGH